MNQFLVIKEGRGLQVTIIPALLCRVILHPRGSDTEIRAHFADGTHSVYTVSHSGGGTIFCCDTFAIALTTAASQVAAK